MSDSSPQPPHRQSRFGKASLGCVGIILALTAFGSLLRQAGCTTPEGLPKVGSEYVCTRTLDGMAMNVNLYDRTDDPLNTVNTSLGPSVRVKILSYTADEKFAFVRVLQGSSAGTVGYVATAIMRK